MRPSFAITALAAALLIVALVIRLSQLQRAVESAVMTNQQFAEMMNATSNRLAEAEKRLEGLQEQSFATTGAGSIGSAALTRDISPARIAALETHVQNLTKDLAQRKPTQTVPEYDPTQPPTQAEAVQPATNSVPRRNWGEEQVVGPPDTDHAGDIPTAWASRQPDAGPEWLAAGFEKDMDIAEVRIRETYNPGAISKVTAVVNGQEVTLWEGTANAGGTAPRDFVVRSPYSVRANSVVVHLDTARVPGWNEIDAVELVGRDGTRQWASSSRASSSYADNSRSPAAETPGAPSAKGR